MSAALLFIAGAGGSGAPALDDRRIVEALKQAGAAELVAVPRRWLAEGEACELAIDGNAGAMAEVVDRLRSAFAPEEAVDVAVVPAEGRRKRLLVADMESTIIEEECLDELAAVAGLGDRIAEITAQAMRGEIAFEGALRARVAMLAGLDARILDEVLDGRVHLTPGAEALVATMRRAGAQTALVSGGFSRFASDIARRLGFDSFQANELEIVDGKITGRLVGPILGRAAKRAALERLVAEHGLERAQTLAVGDGANDLDMIRSAGLGVAYHAKPLVAAEAAVRIDHADLRALLYLQGYARDDFAA